MTGIGGVFFRARDPGALNRWYGEHLGVIMLQSRSYEDPGWFQDRGEAVVSAMKDDTGFFGTPEKQWAGIPVEPHGEPNGRFAELEDPEGNRIQLWEPNETAVARPGRRPLERRLGVVGEQL